MGRDEVELLLSEHGAIRTGRGSHLRSTVERMLRDGELVTVLPGVHTRPDPRWQYRLAAVLQWDPQCVVAGRAAAALTFWSGIDVEDVSVITERRGKHPGFILERRRLPAEWIDQGRGLRRTAAAVTALDLAIETDGESIDRSLRARATTIAQLTEAMSAIPNRIGNPERRRLLLDSRAEAWSAAERLGHRLLRRAGIHGWVANHVMRCEDRNYFPDLTFARERLIVEIDGWEHHRDRDTFIEDRRRQNTLQLDGWLVLRFTWFDLTERPGVFIDQVRQGLKLRITAPIAIG